MFLLLHLLILAINILVINCGEICDCQEIDVLKGIVQQVLLEQKLESAKLRKLEARQRTLSASPGTASTLFADRLTKVETNIADIDKKLNALVKETQEDKGENMDIILKKTIAAEKAERMQFISGMKSQIDDMKETFENFKADITIRIGNSIENISTSEEIFEQGINNKLTEIKGQAEDLVSNVLINVTTFQNDIKLEISRNVEDITNHLNQRLIKTDRKITTLDDIVVKERINGGWTQWGDWSTCSVSCGSGIKQRSRTCSSPSPSVLGRQCEGNTRQTDSCVLKRCPGHRVAFMAYGIAGEATGLVRFPNVIENTGNDYRSTTGKFTCSIPGIYHFVVTLSINNEKDKTEIHCDMFANSKRTIELYVKKHDFDSKNSYPATAAAVLHLSRGDTVYVDNCEEYYRIYNDHSTSFTGFLVSADD